MTVSLHPFSIVSFSHPPKGVQKYAKVAVQKIEFNETLFSHFILKVGLLLLWSSRDFAMTMRLRQCHCANWLTLTANSACERKRLDGVARVRGWQKLKQDSFMDWSFVQKCGACSLNTMGMRAYCISLYMLSIKFYFVEEKVKYFFINTLSFLQI